VGQRGEIGHKATKRRPPSARGRKERGIVADWLTRGRKERGEKRPPQKEEIDVLSGDKRDERIKKKNPGTQIRAVVQKRGPKAERNVEKKKRRKGRRSPQGGTGALAITNRAVLPTGHLPEHRKGAVQVGKRIGTTAICFTQPLKQLDTC